MPDRQGVPPVAVGEIAGKVNSGTEGEKAIEKSDRKNRVTMQNTYRLESQAPFDGDRVATLVDRIMQEMMGNAQYDPVGSVKLAEQVTTEILISVKEMNFDRYRIIVVVSIYEKMLQGIVTRCNALWDAERDDCIACTFMNSSIIASALVAGVYYE